MNDLFLQALRCEAVPRPPIWLMRQVGRYMPQYRSLRTRHSFRTLITTPELAAEVTQFAVPLGVDAAILFSDILLIAEVFGFTIDFADRGGIQLIEPLATTYDWERVQCVHETITLLKSILQIPLIGFCGGPYTVAKYMKRIEPKWLEQITQASIAYLKLQIAAGVDAVQIFDSWAGLLEPTEFETLALPYLQQLVEAIRPFPVILFCRGSCRYVNSLIALRPQGISFDAEQEMKELRATVPSSIAIQGNLEPTILKGELLQLQQQTEKIVTSMKNSRGFIFNLSHGVEPSTPVENVQWLIDYLKHLPTSMS